MASALADKLWFIRKIPMKFLRWVGTAIAALAAALGFGPLGAEMLRNWMAQNGYLEHPEAGVAWLVSTIAGLTKQPWFYYAIAAAITVAIAWVLCIAVPAYVERRRTKRLMLASNMIDLAAGIRQRQGRFVAGNWPDNVNDIRGYIDSCIIETKKAGLYPPPHEVFERGDGVKHLHDYFNRVGILISEGHWKEAKVRARQIRTDLDK